MTTLLNQIERVPLDSVVIHPENPRVGNVAAIAESLKVNSQYEPIVVQASTRYVLAGNHRVLAAQDLGWEEIDAVVVDVDDDHATRIMLSSNRTGDLGSYDLERLVDHLSRLRELDDLAGTGYTDDDLDARLAELHASLGEAVPNAYAPTPGQTGLREVVLLFSDEQHVQFEEWLNTISETTGTNGASETVYAALGIAADSLNA